MTKAELETKVDELMEQTGADLQELWDSINQGQRKQLYKKANIREILERYGVKG